MLQLFNSERENLISAQLSGKISENDGKKYIRSSTRLSKMAKRRISILKWKILKAIPYI